MKLFMALLSGLLFGVGLILSGMSDPSKVLGFLDLAGSWDPSLAFVMSGAVLVGSLMFPFASKRTQSILGEAMRLPTATQIDRRLVLGGLTFGVGWGLAGWLLPWPGAGIACAGRHEAPAVFHCDAGWHGAVRGARTQKNQKNQSCISVGVTRWM